MFFSVLLHRFGSLAPYCIWGAFFPEFTGFFFHLVAVQSPCGSSTAGGKWSERKKKTNPTKGITVVRVSSPPLFVRVREHHLFIRLRGIFLHYSHQLFSVQSFLHFLFSPLAKQESAFFVFQQGSSAPLYVEKHSKVDKRKKKVAEVLRSCSLSK